LKCLLLTIDLVMALPPLLAVSTRCWTESSEGSSSRDCHVDELARLFRQTVLEEGNKDDWFESPFILRLAVVALVGGPEERAASPLGGGTYTDPRESNEGRVLIMRRHRVAAPRFPTLTPTPLSEGRLSHDLKSEWNSSCLAAHSIKTGLVRRSKRRGHSIALRAMFRAKRQPAVEVSAAGSPVASASTAA
jgi:hypothetical protein